MTSPRYRFTNHRSIAGANYRDPAVWSAAWLDRSQFAEHELPQLLWVLREWGIRGDDPFAIPCSAFQGMAEVPLDRWDIVDQDGTPVYSLWTYMVDSGVIWRYGTNDPIGQIIQFGGEFEDAEVGAALEISLQAARRADPTAPLPDSLA